jgi:hypothetical protein
MTAPNPLNEVGELEDALSHRFDLSIFRGGRYRPGSLRHQRITESLRVRREQSRVGSDFTDAVREFRILDFIDSLTQCDDEAVDVLGQFGDVFLGRADGRLAFEHGGKHIGPSQSKLEFCGQPG